jgi:hypothetical protein
MIPVSRQSEATLVLIAEKGPCVREDLMDVLIERNQLG